MTSQLSTLAELLEACRGRRGVTYLVAMKALKAYLAGIDDEEFKREFNNLSVRAPINYLIAAGLSRSRQQVLAQAEWERGE